VKDTRTNTEYRVISTRAGGIVTDKRYHSLKAVNDRIGRLTSPEPWRFYGSARERQRAGDELACCYGRECGCDGLSLQEASDEKRKELPPIESIRVETRTVTRSKWTAVDIAVASPGLPLIRREHMSENETTRDDDTADIPETTPVDQADGGGNTTAEPATVAEDATK